MIYRDERPFANLPESHDLRAATETRLLELREEHARALQENRELKNRLEWMSGTLLCMVVPCGMVALFAVGRGLYVLAVLMALIGALCWVGGCLAVGEHDA